MFILNPYWRPALTFSVVFSKFSEYLVMIKDGSGFSFRSRNFYIFYIREELLYFDHCENSCKSVLRIKFLLANT